MKVWYFGCLFSCTQCWYARASHVMRRVAALNWSIFVRLRIMLLRQNLLLSLRCASLVVVKLWKSFFYWFLCC